MSTELSGYDVAGRLEIARACWGRLNHLVLLVKELTESTITIDSLDRIEKFDAIVEELRPHLLRARDEYGDDRGPTVRVSESILSPAFTGFVVGWSSAAIALREIQKDRRFRGDTDWPRYRRQAGPLRSSQRNFASFIETIRELGLDTTSEPAAVVTSDRPQQTPRRESESQKRTRKGEIPAWLGVAIASVFNDPRKLDKEVAAEAGVHPGALSRSMEYQAAAKRARETVATTRRGFLHDGKVDCEFNAEEA